MSATFEFALHDEEYTHILLILPVSAALILLRWGSPENGSGPVSPVAPPCWPSRAPDGLDGNRGMLISQDFRLAVMMSGLVGWWIASFVLCFGTRGFSKVSFFSLLLVLAGSASGSSAGTDGGSVAASIRSSLMLLVTSMVLPHLFLGSVWRKMVVILLAVPLSVAKNAVQIFTLSILGTHVDPGFLTGTLHHNGGIVFFLLALVFVVLLVKVLRRYESGTVYRFRFCAA